MTNFSKEIPPAPNEADSISGSVDKHEVLDYDSESKTYRASFDNSKGPVSAAVISTVAAVAGISSLDLESLYSCIDPDALDAVVKSAGIDPSSDDIRVSFTFDDYPVTVHSAGIITVDQPN